MSSEAEKSGEMLQQANFARHAFPRNMRDRQAVTIDMGSTLTLALQPAFIVGHRAFRLHLIGVRVCHEEPCKKSQRPKIPSGGAVDESWFESDPRTVRLPHVFSGCGEVHDAQSNSYPMRIKCSH